MNKNARLFLSYVLPSMVGMLIVGSYSIVDTIFIGWSAGELGLASVAVTWPLVMMFGAVGDMLGTGAAIIIAQSRGSGNLRLARLSLGNMLVWQVLFSLLMMTVVNCFLTDILRLFGATDELMPGAVRYSRILIYGNLAYMLVTGVLAVIRNDGRPVLSMWLMVGGLLLNIVMDYVFIFPLGGGVAGAAYATVTAQMLIAVAGLAYFFTRKTALRFDRQMFKLKPKYLKNIVVSGFPSLGNQLSIIAMLFFHNYQALKYGRVDGLAAYTFIGAVESLGSLLMTGLALGVQPLVAYLYGGGRHRRHYRQHGLLYRFRIGNCADVRIGCRTRRFSRLVQFARQCGGSCRTRTGYQFDGVRTAGSDPCGRLLLSGDRQNHGFFAVDLR